MLTFKKYQKGFSEGNLLSVVCEKCDIYMPPSQAVCYQCGNKELTIKKVSKEGIIRTFTVIRVAPENFDFPFVVAIVETKDKVSLLGNLLESDPECLNTTLIGKKVDISLLSQINHTGSCRKKGSTNIIFILKN